MTREKLGKQLTQLVLQAAVDWYRLRARREYTPAMMQRREVFLEKCIEDFVEQRFELGADPIEALR